MHQDRETIHYNLSLPDFLPDSKSSLQFDVPKPEYTRTGCAIYTLYEIFFVNILLAIDLYTKRGWNYIHSTLDGNLGFFFSVQYSIYSLKSGIFFVPTQDTN